MFCRQCGFELPDGALFCGSCGTAVKPEAPQGGESATAATPVDAPETAAVAVATAPVQTGSGTVAARKTTLLVAGACAVVIVAIATCFMVMNPFGAKKATVSASNTASSAAVTVNGTTVKALDRPALTTTAVQTSSSMVAAPALAEYATSSSSSGSTSANATVKNTYGTLTELKPTSGLGNVTNVGDFYLTNTQKSALEQNMFTVNASGGQNEFFDTYESNRYSQQASFVTVDSMMHTYHLYFSHLQKNSEKQYLSASLLTLSTAMLQASADQLNTLSGSEWEGAAQRNVVFFSVAARLLDPSVQTPASVEPIVSDELAKIQNASGTSTCAITNDYEDYTQYKPRGYYEGDAQLESYFRAMMWYGRINFTQKNEDLDRSALLISLALDGGNGGKPNANWESIYTVTSFFAGASDDLSYYEYYPLFAYSYGDGATVASLAGNTKAWDTYHSLTAQMPAPKISSVVVGDESQVTDSDIKGFRFMGQRFSIDETVFQQLVYDNVGTKENPRMLPSALDMPAALGSDEALSILASSGKTSYENYDSQMKLLRTDLANSDDSLWNASLYSQWLYTLNPLLVTKGEGYPTFMQSSAWTRKNLQSYLGSYTELKHDTVLYSKQAMVEMGGGVQKKDDRGYVEPEPDLYGRLANLTQTTSTGLAGYGMLSSEDADNLKILQDLATKLQTISQKELAGETPTTEEYDLIRTYGGQLEHFWAAANTTTSKAANRSAEFPAAVVVDVATDNSDGKVLELGTGKVTSIYVLVPIDGQLHLCEGATYSYYEFEQLQSNRLTDSTWRGMLGITGSSKQSTSMPSQPDWVKSFQTN